MTQQMNQEPMQKAIEEGLKHFFSGEGTEDLKQLLTAYMDEMKSFEGQSEANQKMVSEMRKTSQKMVDEMMAALGISKEEIEGYLANAQNFAPDLWNMMQTFTGEKDVSKAEKWIKS